METQSNLEIDTTTDLGNDAVSLFGGKIRIPKKHIGIYKIVIPLIFVIICAVVTSVMVNVKLENTKNIDGKFVLSVNPNDEYIDMDSDGEYVMKKSGKKNSGKWNLEGTKLSFKSGSLSFEGGFVER